MKIDIERLGLKNVAVDPDSVFTFPAGIAGFEQCTRFKLFHEEGKPTVFWLQSLDQVDVMFPVVLPETLDLEYQIDLSDAGAQRPDDILSASQDAERVRDALSRLKPDQVDVLRLAFFMDSPHSEIARRLDLPLGTVKSRIRNAMIKLRLILEPSGEASR